MTDGIKITQQGVDVKNAPGYQMVLNSQAKTLNVIYDEYISGTTKPNTETIIYSHKLGYTPAYYFYGNTDYAVNAPYGGMSTVSCDKQNFYVSGDANGDYRGRLIIFNIDPTEEYKSEDTVITKASSRKSLFGAKVAVDGSNIQSINLTDISFDTNSRSMVVHMTGVRIAIDPRVNSLNGFGEINMTHNLSYLPAYMTYGVSYNGKSISRLTGNGYGTNAKTVSNLNNLGFQGVQSSLGEGTSFAIVVLKDPLLL